MRMSLSSSIDGGLYGAGGVWISRPDGKLATKGAEAGISWVLIYTPKLVTRFSEWEPGQG